MRSLKTLGFRRFMLAATVSIVMIAVAITTLLQFQIQQRLFYSQAESQAAGIGQQVFASMNQIMRLGWDREQLAQFLDALHDSFDDTATRIELYRSEKVAALYGTLIPQPHPDAAVVKAFQTGERVVLNDHDRHFQRYLYPIETQPECLSCHTNSSLGDVLGVVEVRQDLSRLDSAFRREQFLLFLGVGGGALGLAALLAVFVTRRLGRAVASLHAQARHINSVEDLHALHPREMDLGFTEFNDVMGQFEGIAERLRRVAVDKNVLEKELRLFDRFIVTSQVVRNWRGHVRRLLRESTDMVHVPVLFTCFEKCEGRFGLDVFWHANPDEATRQRFEQALVQRCRDAFDAVPNPVIQTRHTVTHTDRTLDSLSPQDTKTLTQSLSLEQPRVQGLVGVHLNPALAEEPVRHMVAEGLLTTVTNMVGSVKAVQQYTRDMEYYATRDALTKLYNQRMFWELLDYEVNRASQQELTFALLLLDFDNFKAINDRYGHAEGDRLLVQVAEALKAAVRNEDVVARYGGDEFAIILPKADTESAMARARHIMKRLELLSPITPDGAHFKATASIGVAMYPEHGRDARDLFLIADNMMYSAKRHGKNTALLPDEHDVASTVKKAGEIGLALMAAVDDPDAVIPYYQPIVTRRRRGGADPDALQPYFQPIVARGRDATIHEVLMRLRHNGEILPAGHFIATADRLGILHKLDDILMEKTFAHAHATGYQGRLFINVSPKSLLVGGFIRKLRTLVSRYRIPPEQVVFEITERDTVRNLDLLERFVYALKEEGFKFAIDDFGSGFSSLHYIKRFPIDFIKIEGEFVRNMLRDPRDHALVEATTQMARRFGIATVAEFVEDAAILDAVWALGIDYAQGFHTGYPGPDFSQMRSD